MKRDDANIPSLIDQEVPGDVGCESKTDRPQVRLHFPDRYRERQHSDQVFYVTFN